MPLAMEATRFRTGATEIQSETMGGFFSWATYAFVQPRACGQSLYWAAGGLYDIFRLSSFGGSSSTWDSRKRTTWSKAWRVAFGDEMFVDGAMITGRNQEKTSAPWHERCLLEPSIGTLGLISVLHRWAIGGRSCLKRVIVQPSFRTPCSRSSSALATGKQKQHSRGQYGLCSTKIGHPRGRWRTLRWTPCVSFGWTLTSVALLT